MDWSILDDPRYTHGYGVWPRTIEKLAEQFGCRILGTYELYYFPNLHVLHQLLKQSRKEVYSVEEKYLISHLETEYFVGDLGLTIHNFHQMILSLDIDPCRFVIYTNHRGSIPQWHSYCPDPNNRYHVIESPVNTRTWRWPQDSSFIPGHNIEYKFTTMMGQARIHRELLAKFLLQQDLVHSNPMTINHIIKDHKYRPDKNLQDFDTYVSDPNFVQLTTRPYRWQTNTWRMDSDLEQVFQTEFNPPYTHPLISVSFENIVNTVDTKEFRSDWYEKIFVDLVTETVYHYPYAQVTEKTLRPIISSRPFLVVGAPNTLKWLHELGFQTFHDFWLEDYDQETDPNQRFRMIIDTIKLIDSWSLDRCRETIDAMRPILEHNLKRYCTLMDDPYTL
jgi:hypothetical protein